MVIYPPDRPVSAKRGRILLLETTRLRLLHSQLDGFTRPDALTPRSRSLSVHISTYLTLAHLAQLASRLLYWGRLGSLSLQGVRAKWTWDLWPSSSGGHIHLVWSISGKASQRRCQITGASFPSRLLILALTFDQGRREAGHHGNAACQCLDHV